MRSPRICSTLTSFPSWSPDRRDWPAYLTLFRTGWKCCKPRVLTFDEFLAIPPCTTGTHSDVEEKPVEQTKVAHGDTTSIPVASHPTSHQYQQQKQQQEPQNAAPGSNPPRGPVPQRSSSPPPPPAESDSDDASLPLDTSMTCRRRGCNAKFSGDASRGNESCVFHPGWPTFHDGGKGYTCCRRRVLEFDEFMKIDGCETKPRHMFVGSGKKLRQREHGEEIVESVRSVFPFLPSPPILLTCFQFGLCR